MSTDLGELEERKRDIVTGVLAKVNAVRAEMKVPPLHDLPRGMQGEAEWCPIAVAFKEDLEELELAVGGTFLNLEWDFNKVTDLEAEFLQALFKVFPRGRLSIDEGTFTFRNGKEIDQFVTWFDHDNFPEYELSYDEAEEMVYGDEA